MSYDNEKQELQQHVAGRVASLRDMFNKGNGKAVGPADKKVAHDSFYNKRTSEKERKTKLSYTQFKGALDSVENQALRRRREQQEAEKKAAEQTMQSYRNVKTSKTLLDAAAESHKLREEEDRRVAKESKELYTKSSYSVHHDHSYQHTQKKREQERNAEREAKESLLKFSRDGTSYFDEKLEAKKRIDAESRQKELESRQLYAKSSTSTHDHIYEHAQKKREVEQRAEREAKESLLKFTRGSTYFDEQIEQKKRMEEEERRRSQQNREMYAKNNFSVPQHDPSYLRAKELAMAEKEAEEQAKQSLLHYSQVDVSHEITMQNGMMMPKSAPSSQSSGLADVPPAVKSYPFVDRNRKRAPNPEALKAVEKFQQQLAKSRAKAEAKAEAKGGSNERGADIDTIKASVDASSLSSVAAAAKRFAEMEKRAAEKAKSENSRFRNDGETYESQHARNARLRLAEDRAREQEAKECQNLISNTYSYHERAATEARQKEIAQRVLESETKKSINKGSSSVSVYDLHVQQQREREQQDKEYAQEARDSMTLVGVSMSRQDEFHLAAKEKEQAERLSERSNRESLTRNSYQASAAWRPDDFSDLSDSDNEETSKKKKLERQPLSPPVDREMMATRIQAKYRSHLHYVSYTRQVKALITLQSFCRRVNAKRFLLEKRKTKKEKEAYAATQIQRVYRGHMSRNISISLKRKVRSAIVIQSAARRFQSRKCAAVRRHALVTVQRQWRSARNARKLRRDYLCFLKAVISIQRRHRTRSAFRNAMATRLQSEWKRSVAQFKYALILRAVVQMQSAWRRHQAIKMVTNLRERRVLELQALQYRMALRVQSTWRGHMERKLVKNMRDQRKQLMYQRELAMASKIQSRWRCVQAKSLLMKLRQEKAFAIAQNQMATRVQTAWRSKLARAVVAEMRERKRVAEEVEFQKQQSESLASIVIQCRWRSALARLQVAQLRHEQVERVEAASKIQRSFRCHEARKALQYKRVQSDAATRLQALWRAHLDRKNHKRECERVLLRSSSAVRIQSIWRGYVSRRLLRASKEASSKEKAALLVQTHWRKACARSYVSQLRAKQIQEEMTMHQNYCATRIQAIWRGRESRKVVDNIRNDLDTHREHYHATRIQLFWRQIVAKRRVADLKSVQLRHGMATRIQRTWRRYLSKPNDEEENMVDCHTAAELIQATWRKYHIRRVRALAASATTIQSLWRMRSAKRAMLSMMATKKREVESAIAIQSMWRGISVRAEQRQLKYRIEASVKIQSCVRSALARMQLKTLRDSKASHEQVARACATRIQAHWRGKCARKYVKEIQNKEAESKHVMAMRIQTCWRGKMARTRVEKLLYQQAARETATKTLTATKIQAIWRSSLAKKHVQHLRYQREKEVMVTVIQAHWRGLAARRHLQSLKVEAERKAFFESKVNDVQRVWRGHASRKLAWNMKQERQKEAYSAVVVQSVWRGHQQRRRWRRQSESVVVMQALARGAISRKRVATMKHDACIEGTVDNVMELILDGVLSECEESYASSVTESMHSDDVGSTSADTERERALRRQPTQAELELLSMRGRLSNDVEDDSEDESDEDYDEGFVSEEHSALSEDVGSTPLDKIAGVDSEIEKTGSVPIRGSVDSFTSPLARSLAEQSFDFDHSDVDEYSDNDDADSFEDAIEIPSSNRFISVPSTGSAPVSSVAPTSAAPSSAADDDMLAFDFQQVTDARSSDVDESRASNMSSRMSERSSSVARDSYGYSSSLSNSTHTASMKADTAPELMLDSEDEDDQQYFDSESERRSSFGTDYPSMSSRGSQLDSRPAVSNNGELESMVSPPTSSGGSRWAPSNLLNRIATDKLTQMSRKLSGGKMSNGSGTEDDAPTVSEESVGEQPPSSGPKKEGSPTNASSVSEETVDEAVYSPTSQDGGKGGKSKFGVFSAFSAAASAASSAASSAAPTGFAKRFGWKKTKKGSTAA